MTIGEIYAEINLRIQQLCRARRELDLSIQNLRAMLPERRRQNKIVLLRPGRNGEMDEVVIGDKKAGRNEPGNK